MEYKNSLALFFVVMMLFQTSTAQKVTVSKEGVYILHTNYDNKNKYY